VPGRGGGVSMEEDSALEEGATGAGRVRASVDFSRNSRMGTLALDSGRCCGGREGDEWCCWSGRNLCGAGGRAGAWAKVRSGRRRWEEGEGAGGMFSRVWRRKEMKR
jgi:hypothetical protein